MKLRAETFEIEVNRAALTLYARAGKFETLLSLDDRLDNSVCWRGRTIWPSWKVNDTDTAHRPLTAEELDAGAAEAAVQRAERGRTWWRKVLRGAVPTGMI